MTNRLVDPVRFERPLALEWPDGDDRTYDFRNGGGRKKRAASVWTLLAMLVVALVLVPAALADDDDDDDGGPPAPPTIAELCTATMAPTNLVRNGDFELPQLAGGFLTYPSPPAGPPDWALTEGSVDQVHRTFWEPACGNQSMDMTGSAPTPPGQGTLLQNVPTTAGQEYLLQFAYAANSDPACDLIGEPTELEMVVRWGGQVVTTLTIQRVPDASPPSTPNWQPFQATVVGQAGATPLEFDSNSGRFCGPALDAVSVQLSEDGDDDDDDDDDDDGGDDDD